MSTKVVRIDTSVARVDMKVEVVVIPVSDVDRAKEFYGKLGWRLAVTPPGVTQFTPPGSGCSVVFGTNLTSAAPGSAMACLIVSDIEAARDKRLLIGGRLLPSDWSVTAGASIAIN
jgi:predicted enzyme related to lactoylglutathione lyase